MREGLPARLVEFSTALREHGVVVGTSETVDAGLVIGVLGLHDRGLLREGLAAALLRRSGQRTVFDELFELYFPVAQGERSRVREAPASLEEFRQRLLEAVIEGDREAVQELAVLAVDLYGVLDVGTSGFSAQKALERVQAQTLVSPGVAGRTGAGEPSNDPIASGRWSREFVTDEVRALIATFTKTAIGEAGRRQAELRGRERISTLTVRATRDQIDFMTASPEELEELRRAVRPLGRRLATRLAARRKRGRRGAIDIRRTLRSSMSTGGVPVKLAFARPRPTRPELVLLCDVSGSVSSFSNFTMLLVQTLKAQFSRIRVFAFVNATDEVTDFITDDRDDDLQARIHAEADVTTWHTGSNYGEAFREFVEKYLGAVTPRTSVLILGDARNNRHSANIEAVELIASKSRRTFWLNPEPAARWGSDDSLALDYARVVDMHECRTVDQLTTFVSRLLPV